jgi:hypothetical protein
LKTTSRASCLPAFPDQTRPDQIKRLRNLGLSQPLFQQQTAHSCFFSVARACFPLLRTSAPPPPPIPRLRSSRRHQTLRGWPLLRALLDDTGIHPPQRPVPASYIWYVATKSGQAVTCDAVRDPAQGTPPSECAQRHHALRRPAPAHIPEELCCAQRISSTRSRPRQRLTSAPSRHPIQRPPARHEPLPARSASIRGYLCSRRIR